MIKEFVKDTLFLGRPSTPATSLDKQIGIDLVDTMLNNERCIGIAANMIGELKCVIAFLVQPQNIPVVMYNPEIVSTMGSAYKTMEGCMCHIGEREAIRYPKIKVKYQDENFKTKMKTFDGLNAQIIQHEIDHCHGILI